MTLVSTITVLLLVAAFPDAFSRHQDRSTQEPERPAAPQATFRAESELVVLHVTVFDRDAKAIPDLPASAFTVVEDGVPQMITFFSDEEGSAAIGLLIDNSSSMITRRPMVEAGGRAFAASVRPDDEMFTVIFNEHVRWGLPHNIAFTRSRPLVLSTLRVHPAGGMTALYDAVIAGLDHLEEATLQRRVLVVLSDGDDNASQSTERNMLRRASESDALVYAIGTGDVTRGPSNPGVLKRLARATGGLAYFPDSEREVVEAFAQIAHNIHRGYRIGYVPNPPATKGDYRRIVVLAHAGGRLLTVHARHGYRTTTESQSR